MPGHTTESGHKKMNAYASGSTNSMKSNGFAKNKYYQSRNDKYHFKSSININDPNDWPTLGETSLTNGTTNEIKARNGLDTNGTVFNKKKIVQTKNTTTPNGDMVETTVIEETDTFSKLVISKEPSNKDSNNNRLSNSVNNDNESTSGSTETSSQLDDESLDNSDEKENSKCDLSSAASNDKKASSTTTEQSLDEQSTNKNKKKSSKSKWKVLEIEPSARPLIEHKRKFDRRDNRDPFRERRDYRDSRIINKRKDYKDYNNSNGKYGDSYYRENRNKYSNYSNNHNSSSNHQYKDSQNNHLTSANTENESSNKANSNASTTNSNNTNNNSNTTQQSQPANKSSTINSSNSQQQTDKNMAPLMNGQYSNNIHSRQKRISGNTGGRIYRSNRSMSGNYRQYKNNRMHYDSGNVTPLSDYDYNGFYLENGAHQQPQLTNGATNSNANINNNQHQPNGFMPTPVYYGFSQVSPNPSRFKWPPIEDSLRIQIEYYFSEGNLQRDFFLRRKMDKNGYLPISLIASFHRVQALTMQTNKIIDSLKKSEKLELSEDGRKVRTKVDPTKWPLLDQVHYPLEPFELAKSVSNNTNSSGNSKESSTDSANDSRNSGVSFQSFTSSGTTDLHPNVPEFVPGQPYGYLYDGANNCNYVHGVYYSQPSFQKSPIVDSNSYTITNMNYQVPYNQVYSMNSADLIDQSTDNNNKIVDNENSNEITNELNDQQDNLADSNLAKKDEEEIDNQKTTESDENKEEVQSEQTPCADSSLNVKENEEEESNKKPTEEVSNQEDKKSNNELNKEDECQTINKNKSNLKDEESTSKNQATINKAKATTTLVNEQEKLSDTSSKENDSSSLNKSTSNSSSIASTSNKNTETVVQQAPVKILSYSDAIKLKEKPSNKQEEQQVKKDNDSPNKQTETASSDSNEDKNESENLKENLKENRREKRSNDKKSRDNFHGFHRKSKNRSSAKK